MHLAGYGGQAADSAEAFEGIDTNLILITLLVVIVILLLTYRSPILWLLPIISAVFAYMTSAGVVYLLAKYADLTVNGQSQAILGILVIGAGTDYALLLVARYREELRRHEDRHEAMAFALHRAAPAILASAATVVVSMLCLSFAELNSTAGMGPVLAVGIAVTFLVMVTLLPGAAGHLRPLGLLAEAADVRLAEPTSTGFWARVGNRIAPKPRKVWMVTAGLLAIACLGLFRLDASGPVDRGHLHQGVRLDQGSAGARRRTAWPTTPTPSRSSPTPMPCPRCRRRWRGSTASARPAPPRTWAPGAPTSRPPSTPTSRPRPRSPSWSPPAMPSTGSTGPTPWSVAGAAFYLDTKVASNRDNKVIIPIVLVVVFLILMGLLRACGAADPDRHGDPVVRRGAGHLGAVVRVRVRVRRAPTQASRCSRSCSWSPWASTTTSS